MPDDRILARAIAIETEVRLGFSGAREELAAIAEATRVGDARIATALTEVAIAIVKLAGKLDDLHVTAREDY